MATRETILNHVVTTLVAITVAGGYNNDIRFVTRESVQWERYNKQDYPLAIVAWTLEVPEIPGATSQSVVMDLTVTVRCVVYATTNLETVLNLFLDDVEKALCVDGTRGGAAWSTLPDVKEVLLTENESIIVCDFDFIIRYEYVYGTP